MKLAVGNFSTSKKSALLKWVSSFGTPVLNVGRRQNLRERNANLVDAPAEAGPVREGIARLLAHGRFARANIYSVPGGTAAGRIAALLAAATLDETLLMKANRY